MAELERAEHGDGGSARVWMQRAVRAALDPAWTADGYVSEHWRPVSPVTGRLDAFQWLTPVAALPSEKAPVLEAEVADEPALPLEAGPAVKLPPPAVPLQDNEPAPVPSAPAPVEQAAPPPAAPVIANVPPPVFRPRREIEKPDSPRIPAVIPIVRAPDDPGVADEARDEEFDDPVQPEPAQRGGWKGFLSRLVS